MSRRSDQVPIQSHGRNRVFHPLAGLRSEVEHALDRAAKGWHQLHSTLGKPLADVTEGKGDYEISIELPGVDQNSIELTLRGGVLYLVGEKTYERQQMDRNYYLRERAYGVFRRAFQVPDDVDADKIDAQFSQGVLTISLPRVKRARAGRKRIAVKAT